MKQGDDQPICHQSGQCQTATGDPSDLDMCIHCGALMYYIDIEGRWVHYSVIDDK